MTQSGSQVSKDLPIEEFMERDLPIVTNPIFNVQSSKSSTQDQILEKKEEETLVKITPPKIKEIDTPRELEKSAKT